MHDLPLISTIAAAFTAAWLLGLLTQWLRLSPIVGYLLAGIIIGPHTPGFVGDMHLAHQLAEVGVILLMFGVGLHFHLKDLLAVKSVAVPGAVVQSLMATVMAMVIFHAFGMSLKTGAVLGMAMAVASTVVLMRVLMDADSLSSRHGHVAVGWLIVEDIFTVILLVLIPVMGTDPAAIQAGVEANNGNFWVTLGIALAKLVVLVAIVLVAGAKIVPWLLVRVARLRSRELFTLTVLVFSVAIASAAYFFFGASMALGAFLAGMVVAQSPVSHQAAADALPLRDAFAVLFFVSVGMLFDPAFLIQEPLMVLAALFIIFIIKPLAALLIVWILGHSVRTALTVALGLAQIGEFSFILSDLARKYQLMPDSGHNVLVASAILSITLNPLIFRSIPQIETWLRGKPRLWKLLNYRAEKKATTISADISSPTPTHKREQYAIVVGYGPVGRAVHRALEEAKISTVVIDMNMDTISELRAQGKTSIYGDASNQEILEQAGMKHASHLVVTVPNASLRLAIITASRAISSTVRIVARAHYLRERTELEHSGVSAAVFEEAEAAIALSRLVLADTGVHRNAVERKIHDIRFQLIMDNLSNLRSQRVSTVMIPWPQVHKLSSRATRQEVLAQISQEPFSRWPVVDPGTRRPIGYLASKHLLSATDGETPWTDFIQPLNSIDPHISIDVALNRMQDESTSLYLVEDAGVIIGMVTLEDVLEQVVGKLETKNSREITPDSLYAALKLGTVLSHMEATTKAEAIQELTSALPSHRLPAGTDHAKILELTLDREEEISTDLGNGIAVPHARCPGLVAPVIVVGRSEEGIPFSTEGDNPPVHLFFLLITPTERPETQLSLLRQVAKLADSDKNREALMNAQTPADMLAVLST
ncbi:MAG: cation:proton antiporter [Luteolibacter sp.]